MNLFIINNWVDVFSKYVYIYVCVCDLIKNFISYQTRLDFQ